MFEKMTKSYLKQIVSSMNRKLSPHLWTSGDKGLIIRARSLFQFCSYLRKIIINILFTVDKKAARSFVYVLEQMSNTNEMYSKFI